MSRRWIVVGLVVATVIVGLAWTTRRQVALVDQNSRQLRTIAALEQQLDASRQELVEQRQLLRGQTLATASRTPDEFLALFPAKFPQGDWRAAETSFEDCWFHSADGLRLHGWLLHCDRPKYVILLMHGNAGNLSHRAAAAQLLSERYSASVLIFDYRGYGRSEGTPTIPGLLLDARAARSLLAEREQVRPEEIVLFGESLGGAVAVDLAAEEGARALILQSTFSSLKEVAAIHYPVVLVDALVANRLDSVTKIEQYHGPLLQVHGDADRTIPFSLGRKLFEAANEPKTFVSLFGHDHNDALPESFFQSLDSLMSQLAAVAQ